MDILEQFAYINRKIRDFGNIFGKASPEYLRLTTALETMVDDEMLKISKGGYLQIDKSDSYRFFNDIELKENLDAVQKYFENFGGIMSHARPYFEESGIGEIKNRAELRRRLDELRKLAKQETIRQGLSDTFYILLDDLPNKDLIREIKDSMSGSEGKGGQAKQWDKYNRAMERFREALKTGEAYERKLRMTGAADGGTPLGDIFRR